MHPTLQPEAGRARVLAESLDCLTEQDVCELYDIELSTAENWRKRGKGPEYILAGNRYLYPRAAVAADLESRTRKRQCGAGKAAL